LALFWRYNGLVATIQIKELPEEVVRKYKVRAAKAGQSLQAYMHAYLTEGAQRPTREEMIERLSSRSGGSVTFKEAADLVRRDRESH
jgi:plasmid stability protein